MISRCHSCLTPAHNHPVRLEIEKGSKGISGADDRVVLRPGVFRCNQVQSRHGQIPGGFGGGKHDPGVIPAFKQKQPVWNS